VRWRTSRKKTVALARSSVTPLTKAVRIRIAKGRNSSAAENGWRSPNMSRNSGASESAKLTKLEPTTESGKTACGSRTLRMRSWLPSTDASPCETAVLK
jgi:hypothetical protein